MMIRISIERTEPLTGTAAAGRRAPVRFVGWLELLRTISDLVDADGRHGDRAPAAEAGPPRSPHRSVQRVPHRGSSPHTQPSG